MVTGIRIDNCHSTPLHVGQELVRRGREVNPHLFVVGLQRQFLVLPRVVKPEVFPRGTVHTLGTAH